MESLSADLAQRLLSLGLCTPRQLRRCRSRVRRLTRDLPAFDSVWLDALVQAGCLTPYQARILDSRSADELIVGPLVLVERLSDDGRLATFTAQQPGRKGLCEVTFVRAAKEAQPAILERLRESQQSWSTCGDRRLALATAAHIDRDRIVVVSPYVPGSTLLELLIRRGRFPISVVVGIARQMTAALQALEQCSGLHGDLRLRNVRICDRGRLTLLQAGVLAAAEPQFTIHADIPADCYDGIAPERIEIQSPRTIASDIYACGCLWWQLLAGRPPFPAGDPLVKLAAHQQRAVDDVRTWRPETPAPLAELLQSMTHREPGTRPESFSEIASVLGRSASGATRLRRFVRAFESAAPASSLDPDRVARSRLPLAAAGTAALIAIATGLFVGGRNEWTQLALRAGEQFSFALPSGDGGLISQETTGDAVPPSVSLVSAAVDHRSAQAIPLPAAVNGVIELTGPGPYEARDIAVVGPLVIEASGVPRASIHVGAEGWGLSAATLVMKQIDVLRTPSAGVTSLKQSAPLVRVTAQDLGFIGCRIDGGPLAASPMGTMPSAPLISWRLIDARDATGGRIGIQQTALLGPGEAIDCVDNPRSVLMQQSLRVGGGSLLSLPLTSSRQPVTVVLRHSTVRECAALVTVTVQEPEGVPLTTLNLTLEHTVLTPQAGGCVVGVRGVQHPRLVENWLGSIRVSGFETLLQNDVPLAGGVAPDKSPVPLDASAMAIEGVRYAGLEFAGPLSREPADARLHAADAVGRSGVLAGPSEEAFAVWGSRAYNSVTTQPETGESSASAAAASPATR